MPVPELVSSAIAVCSIVMVIGLYVLYCDMLSLFPTQMQLARTGPARSGLLVIEDISKGLGNVRQRAIEGIDPVKARTAFAHRQGEPQLPPDHVAHAGAITDRFGAALVFTTDTILDHASDIHVPVKVAGDLTIDGHVAFHEIVVVDGTLFVRGHAELLGGALVKGEVVVDGLISVDGRSRNAWLVGNRVRGSGVLAVSRSNRCEDVLEAA